MCMLLVVLLCRMTSCWPEGMEKTSEYEAHNIKVFVCMCVSLFV